MRRLRTGCFGLLFQALKDFSNFFHFGLDFLFADSVNCPCEDLLQNARTRHCEGACDREIRPIHAEKAEKETDFSLRSK